jgi:hypothetical protein
MQKDKNKNINAANHHRDLLTTPEGPVWKPQIR